jgi:hypothetical protein
LEERLHGVGERALLDAYDLMPFVTQQEDEVDDLLCVDAVLP